MFLRKKWNKFFYVNTKIGADPDSSWKLQNEKMKTNEAYKLLNLSGGGVLVELYDEGGIDEKYETKKERFREFCAENIESKFFHTGVHTICEDEYRKWTTALVKESKDHIQLKEEEESVMVEIQNMFDEEGEQNGAVSLASLDTVLSKYHDHPCFWKLDKRGAVGETAFLLCFINNTPKHLEIAKILLELYPEMAVDAYMGIDYYGETGLHLAIIQNHIESVEHLLSIVHTDIHARARGKFFIPTDIKRGNVTMKKKNYEGFAYYGEYPLSFAAGIGNPDIYDLLVEHGADVNKRDQFGNTALHLTVVHNKPDMFHHVVLHRTDPANAEIENKSHLTPIGLAAKLGRTDMFKVILDISSRKFWSYSHMVCSAYPLNNLDTISPTGDTNWKSGLMQIIQGRKDRHLDMLEGGVVTNLLDKKWTIFARGKFLRLFFFHVLHILFLSCAVYLRPYDVNDLFGATDASSIARYVFEILTCLNSVAAVFYALREIYIETIVGFWQNIRTIPSRLLYYSGCILILACIPARLTNSVNTEDWFLVFAIPFLWSYFLFFARGLPLTGPFVTMIYSMIKTDLLRFFLIYFIMVVTSGVVFFYIFKGLNVFAFLTELGTFMTLIQMSLGEFDYDVVKQSRYPALGVILFIVYMLLVHVLLLNMLIAMMTRTYERIAKKTKKEWRRQWASIVIIMERSYNPKEKLYFQDLYSTQMGAVRVTSSGDATDLGIPSKNEPDPIELIKDRGLLYIHDKGVSSGKRKAAVTGTWKRAGKEALETIKRIR